MRGTGLNKSYKVVVGHSASRSKVLKDCLQLSVGNRSFGKFGVRSHKALELFKIDGAVVVVVVEFKKFAPILAAKTKRVRCRFQFPRDGTRRSRRCKPLPCSKTSCSHAGKAKEVTHRGGGEEWIILQVVPGTVSCRIGEGGHRGAVCAVRSTGLPTWFLFGSHISQ